MAIEQNLFTSFAQAQRPLSVHLRSRQDVRALFDAARRATTTDELDTFRGSRLTERIASIRPAAPVVGAHGLGEIRDGEGAPRAIGPGTRVPTARYWHRFRVDGDASLLTFWPDQADQEPLHPVDDELMAKIGGHDNLQGASASDVEEYLRLAATWALRLVLDPGPWALYTYLDLTREEEHAHAQQGSMAPVINGRLERVVPIALAIAEQTDRFYDEELPARIESLAADRGALLMDRAAIIQSLDLPPEWANDPIVLEEQMPLPAVPIQATSIDESEPDPSATLDILGTSYRLSPKSFGDVLRTIRTWADAVERNPRGFGDLDEDSFSDLLAATLNATTPYAGREVYSRSGKTDISVQADVLSAGSGPAEVFLLEAKVNATRDEIVQGLEEQIVRYAPARNTSAVLLAICKQRNFTSARENVLRWAEEAEGFAGPPASSGVDTWPVLTYRLDGRQIDVCVATVTVPTVLTRDGKPK